MVIIRCDRHHNVTARPVRDEIIIDELVAIEKQVANIDPVAVRRAGQRPRVVREL